MSASSQVTTGTLVKVTFAAAIGGIVEYYDLFVASLIGAIVWPRIFFPSPSAANSVGFSIASVGLAYIIRPVGGYIFGHIGDKMGRRDTLVITLILLGSSMLAVGLLPTYSTIGMAAPILLFILRGIFGIGVGGEFGGAVAWILEFAANSKRRSFWAIWSAPSLVGLALAGWTVSLFGSILKDDFYTYGWRIPFIIGTVLVVIGFIARYRLEESPLFKAIKEKGKVEKAPAAGVLRHHWKTVSALATITGAIQAGTTSGLVTPFSVAYLTQKGFPFVTVSEFVGTANTLSIIPYLIGPFFCEKLGRKRHLLISILWCLVGVIIFFPLIDTLSASLIFLSYLILDCQRSFNNAAVLATSGESFPIRYRYSGSGLSFQIGNGLFNGIQLTIIFPLIYVFASASLRPILVGAAMVIWMLLALACWATLKETKQADLSV